MLRPDLTQNAPLYTRITGSKSFEDGPYPVEIGPIERPIQGTGLFVAVRTRAFPRGDKRNRIIWFPYVTSDREEAI